MVSDLNSESAKKEIISGFPCHYLSREIVLCYDSCYIFLYMEHVMVHVSCSAGRCGSCIYARRRVRAPGAAGLQPLIEQGCATRGGWRTRIDNNSQPAAATHDQQLPATAGGPPSTSPHPSRPCVASVAWRRVLKPQRPHRGRTIEKACPLRRRSPREPTQG